jgi:hypothetical protein
LSGILEGDCNGRWLQGKELGDGGDRPTAEIGRAISQLGQALFIVIMNGNNLLLRKGFAGDELTS